MMSERDNVTGYYVAKNVENQDKYIGFHAKTNWNLNLFIDKKI